MRMELMTLPHPLTISVSISCMFMLVQTEMSWEAVAELGRTGSDPHEQCAQLRVGASYTVTLI